MTQSTRIKIYHLTVTTHNSSKSWLSHEMWMKQKSEIFLFHHFLIDNLCYFSVWRITAYSTFSLKNSSKFLWFTWAHCNMICCLWAQCYIIKVKVDVIRLQTWSKSLTTATWPYWEAMCREVSPALFYQHITCSISSYARYSIR